MIKVGILSFPRYFNYGTFLQLYALQKTISNHGYQPEIIDYDPYNDSAMKQLDPTSIAGAIRYALRSLTLPLTHALRAFAGRLVPAWSSQPYMERNRLFEGFLHDELALGPKTYFSSNELDKKPPKCAAFIVGSDQVWHPISHFKDPAYYLAFAEPGKRIAYAPSIGLSTIPESSREWMREQILVIPHLSIREEAGASLVEELTGRKARVVLDPAYLLQAQEWTQFGVQPVQTTRPYLLCYILESDQYIRDKAVTIAERYDLELIMLPVHECDMKSGDNRFRKLYNVGPKEFVGLIRDAAFVCTDSFHGTSFSIIFNRPFYTFKRYDNSFQAANHSRLASILKITGLQERVMDKDGDIGQQDLEVDFHYANKQIDRLREDSLCFLQRSIKAAINNGDAQTETGLMQQMEQHHADVSLKSGQHVYAPAD